MRPIRHEIRRLINRAGLDIRRHDDRSDDEAYLALMMHDLDIRHVIDVGANVGQFGSLVRKSLGFSGRLDSYEPGAEAFANLLAAAHDDPGWVVHHAAITNATGPLTLNVSPHSDLSSLSTPTAEATALWAQDWSTRPEVVDGRCLHTEDLPNIGSVFLKLDTQGHDWEALDGAGSVLNRVALIMMELSFVPLYESSRPAWTTISDLHALGFGLASLAPITRPTGEHRLLEADGVFVRARPSRSDDL